MISSFFLDSNQSKSGTTNIKLASELGKNGSVNKYVDEEEEEMVLLQQKSNGNVLTPDEDRAPIIIGPSHFSFDIQHLKLVI